MPCRHAGTVSDRPETTRIILLPNSGVAWQQHFDTSVENALAKILSNSTAETKENKDTPKKNGEMM